MLFLRQIINATDTKTFLAIGPSWVCLHLNFTLGERPLDRVVCELVTKIAFPLDHPVAIWHDIGIRSC